MDDRAAEPWTLVIYSDAIMVKGLIDSKESAEALIKALEANGPLLPSKAQPVGPTPSQEAA